MGLCDPFSRILFTQLNKYYKPWPQNLDGPYFNNCNMHTTQFYTLAKRTFPNDIYKSMYVEFTSSCTSETNVNKNQHE